MPAVFLERRVEVPALCAGRGEGAGGADRDEAGDGAVHEDAGEGRLREAGRSGGAPAAAGRPARHQPAAEPQVTGEVGLPGWSCRTSIKGIM